MREDILERKEEILQWINERQSKAFICRQLLCKPETLNSYLKKMGIEYKGRQNHNKGKQANNYIPALEYLKKEYVSSDLLRQKLIRDGIKEQKCEICGFSEWQGSPIPLELHHKDGNHFNNELNNLQILCPNCHAIQGNNSGANKTYSKLIKENKKNKEEKKKSKKVLCPICKKHEMNKKSNMCIYCSAEQSRLVERPSREELKQLIRTLPFTKIGEKFGVSDNAIRKWCDAEKLPRTKKEINQYTEEEWEKI